MSVFLPLHLDIWKAGTSPAKIISVEIPDSDESIESLEIGDSEGEAIFAIEDGDLIQNDKMKSLGQAMIRATSLPGVDDHTWVYGHIRLKSGIASADGSPIKAGQAIGTVRGGNLLLSSIDADSPELALPGGGTQPVQHSPLDLMDDLDILPLPGDVDDEELDTEEERHAFSESITTAARAPKKPSFLRTALTIGGVGLGVWAFIKIAK